MRSLVEMRGIGKSFFGVPVLQDVDFDVEAGEVHVLLGENGAGKSTLIKVLSGAYRCERGSLKVDGTAVDLTHYSPREAQELGIAAVYQNFHLIPHLTVAENIFIATRRSTGGFIRWRELKRQAAAVLSDFGLELALDAPVRTLTISEKQLLEIAVALSRRARVVIMDEPTSTLSRNEVDTLFSFIGRMVYRQVGVIYISHRLEEIGDVGDRVTILRDGRRVHSGPLTDIDTAGIIRLMTGRTVDSHPRPARRRGSEIYFAVDALEVPKLGTSVSFSVRNGEILGITGLVGSGKSEIARAVFGSDLPTGGSVTLKGMRYRVRSPRSSIARGVGYLPEDRDVEGLCLNMPIRDNITLTYHGKYTGLFYGRSRERRLVERYVDDLTIRCMDPEQQVQFLSGGNKQKVVFAKWLCARCEFLILDEPTIGIDVGARAELYRLVRDFADAGRGVLFVTSDIDEALQVADRLLVVVRRRIAAELDPEGLTKEAVLRQCMEVKQ